MHSTYPFKATGKKHLMRLVKEAIQEQGSNCNLNHIDVSRVKDMSGLFAGVEFNGDISRWNTSKVKNMSAMFMDSPFNGDISAWDTSCATNTTHMFSKSSNDSGVPSFAGDLSQWNLARLEFMDCMFANCTRPVRGLECWNVSNVRSMKGVFSGARLAVDFSNWNVSNVRAMDHMFWGSHGKKGLGNWDVSNVTSMRAMFCSNTDALDIARWNVSKVMNFEDMFFRSSVVGDLSAWNIHPDAAIKGMLDVDNMRAMPNPWLLHWMHAIESEDIDFLTQWPGASEKFNLHMPMLRSVGLPTFAMATWLQKEWLGAHDRTMDSMVLPDMEGPAS